MIRIFWFFIKRILRYDIVLSLAGAALTNARVPSFVQGNGGTTVEFFLVRFACIACSAGYALSVFIYLKFYRNELPLYINAGFSIPKVISVSWCFLLLGSLFLILAAVLFLGWFMA
jgi:hypothetical protein